MSSGERGFLESDSSVERGILFCFGLHKVKHRKHNYGSPTHKIPITGDRLIPANKLIGHGLHLYSVGMEAVTYYY